MLALVSVGLVSAITAGLIIWLVLWSVGVIAIDAFMITIAVALVAATVRMVSPYLPGNRGS